MMSKALEYKSAKDIEDFLQTVQEGDLLEFIRGYYSHWAVYIGGNEVVHRWGENDGVGQPVGYIGNLTTLFGARFEKAEIKRSSLMEVVQSGGKIRVNNYRDEKNKPLPRREILERAILSIGQTGYNLVYANCEHFATDCRYGQSTSRQVEVATQGVVGAGLLLTGGIALAAYFISRSSQKEKDQFEDQSSH